MKLYEIAQELRVLLESEELGEEQVAQIEKLELDLDQKINGICTVMAEMFAEATMLETEATRLSARAGSVSRARKRLIEYLKLCLERAGITRYKTDTWSVRIQSSPPSCAWTKSNDEIPEEFRRTTVTVTPDNKKAIEHWKKTGEAPEGFRIQVGHHVRVE